MQSPVLIAKRYSWLYLSTFLSFFLILMLALSSAPGKWNVAYASHCGVGVGTGIGTGTGNFPGTGPGGPVEVEVRVQASPDLLPADGVSEATIFAHVRDLNGFPLVGANVTFRTTLGFFVPGRTGDPLHQDAVTDLSGIATATLKSSTTGLATVDAVLLDSASNVVACPSITVTFTPPPGPGSIVAFSGDGQVGVAGATLTDPLVVLVLDTNGLAAPGVAVTFSTDKGTLSAASATTSIDGLALTFLTLRTGGAIPDVHTVTATCAACATTTTATFTASTTPPDSIFPILGDLQFAAENTAVLQPLTVVVFDSTFTPLPGVTVTFGTTKGTLTVTSATTDAFGEASTVLTVSTADSPATATVDEGIHTVTATCSACLTEKTATFTATALKVFPALGTVKGFDLLGTALVPPGVAGATVTVFVYQFGLSFTATSAANGTFTVSMPAGDGSLDALRTGFESLGGLEVSMSAAGVQIPLQADTLVPLIRAPLTITGSVTAAGAPVVGAFVSGIEVDSTTGAVIDGAREVVAFTDGTGAYVLQVPASTFWQVSATDINRGTAFVDLNNNQVPDIVSVGAAGVVGQNIVFPPTVSLTGSVRVNGAFATTGVVEAGFIGTLPVGVTPPDAGQAPIDPDGSVDGDYTLLLPIPPAGNTFNFSVIPFAGESSLLPQLIKVRSDGFCLNVNDAIVPCALNFATFTNTITVRFQDQTGAAINVDAAFVSAEATTTFAPNLIHTSTFTVQIANASVATLAVPSRDTASGVPTTTYNVEVELAGVGELLSTSVTVPPDQNLTATVVTSFTISGTVKDSSGNAIAGATVQASSSTVSRSATTAATGAYSITVPAQAALFQLTAAKVGFLSGVLSANVSGDSPNQDFTLTAVTGQATISGVVGGPAANVPVTVVATSTDGKTKTVARGETGPNCGASQVPTPTAYCMTVGSGTWTVKATADGFKTQSPQTVTISGTSSVGNVNLAMTPTGTLAAEKSQCRDTLGCTVEAKFQGGRVFLVIPPNAAGTTGNLITPSVKVTTDAPETADREPVFLTPDGDPAAVELEVRNNVGALITRFRSPLSFGIEGPVSRSFTGTGFFNPATDNWVDLVNCTRTAKSATCQLPHLTKFTLFASRSVAAPAAPAPGGGGGGGAPGPAIIIAPATGTAPIGPAAGTVSISGGSSTDGGVTVSFPAGAVPAVVTFTVSASPTEPADAKALAGTVLLKKTVEVTPATAVTLGDVVTLLINLTEGELAGNPVTSVGVGRLKADGTIDPLPTRVVDVAQGIVAVTIDHFTQFVLYAVTQPVPVLAEPAEAAKLTSLGTTLKWTNPAGTNWFQVQVIPFNNDGPGINLIIGDTALVAAAQYLVSAPNFGGADGNYVMLPGMSYVWRVRTATATAPPGEQDWSPWIARTFQTPTTSSATITLVSPADRATVASNRPTLTWGNTDKAIFYYEVQVSKDQNFGTAPGAPFLYWEFVHGGVTAPVNSYSIPAGFPLESGVTYYWRVRPRIQGDGKPVDWTPARSFATP